MNVSKCLSYSYEPENSANSEHPDHPEECGRHGKVSHEVLHHNTNNGSNHQHKVKQVPGGGEVMMSQTNDLNCGL